MERSDLSESRRRALLGLVALGFLLLIAAVASSGSVPTGAGGARRPSDGVLDVLFSLFLLLMACGALLWGAILLIRRGVQSDAQAGRPGRSPWASILGIAAGLLLAAGAARWLAADKGLRDGRVVGLGAPNRIADGAAGSPNAYQPEFATRPVLIVLALLAVVGVAWYRAGRSRRRRPTTGASPLFPPLANVLEETLDDLRAEANPRRAVIAAYARMERSLGAYGLARSPAEAPDEYLARILADLDVSRRSTSRLTALFARAKFSTHDVGVEMKQDAINALEAVRDELRAAEIQRHAGSIGLPAEVTR